MKVSASVSCRRSATVPMCETCRGFRVWVRGQKSQIVYLKLTSNFGPFWWISFFFLRKIF